MIKLQGKILRFDSINNNGYIFPKNCKIDIPEKIPLLLDFDRGNVIGICEVNQDSEGLTAKGVSHLEEVKTILGQEKIGAGGYYNCVKFHNENGVKVIDKCKLQYVSMTLEPADEHCSFEIVREDKNK